MYRGSLQISVDQIKMQLNSQNSEMIEFSNSQRFRKASVLVPLFNYDHTWHLLYTKRTEILPDHKGQVSFPGGSIEPGDESVEKTALRESYEEIGLRAEDVEILGRMTPMITNTGYLITPVVGLIPWPYHFILSPFEVDRVFSIPLNWLAEPSNRQVKTMVLRGQRVDGVIFYSFYEDELLWGITARITVNLLQILKLIA